MPDVIIPVRDEAQALEWVLERIPSGFNPIVVDNGSTDGSAQLAASAGATVVAEPTPGFGAACFAGLLSASAAVVCFIDGDGSCDPRELPRVAIPVLNREADLVLGCRIPATAGAWPRHARIANRALALELRRRCGVRLTDIGPMRALRREPALSLGLVDRRYGWPLEMVLRAACAGWRVQEVGVSYLPRKGGRSKVTGSVRGTVLAMRDMAAALSVA